MPRYKPVIADADIAHEQEVRRNLLQAAVEGARVKDAMVASRRRRTLQGLPALKRSSSSHVAMSMTACPE